MEITFEQDIYFSNKEHLPLKEVAQSLLALDKNAQAAPAALERIFDDLTVQDLVLFVDNLQSGSLTEKIIYRLKVALQKHIEDESDNELGRLSKLPEERREQIASWIMAAVLIMGIKAAADYFKPGAGKPNIEQQVNITLDQGHELTGVDQETLRRIIDESLRETPGAVQGAVEFARPAKRDPSASISIGNSPVLPKEALAEVPSAIVDQSTNEKSVDLESTQIIIRATDKDSGKRGWGATIPEFSQRRMKISVAPGIDLNMLAHEDVVIGNVTIFYATDSQGNVLRPHAHIFSVDLGRRLAGAP